MYSGIRKPRVSYTMLLAIIFLVIKCAFVSDGGQYLAQGPDEELCIVPFSTV